MASELRAEAARLEQEIKALLKAADVLDKAAQKDAQEPVEQKTDGDMLRMRNVA